MEREGGGGGEGVECLIENKIHTVYAKTMLRWYCRFSASTDMVTYRLNKICVVDVGSVALLINHRQCIHLRIQPDPKMNSVTVIK